jgi:hypothetical protein
MIEGGWGFIVAAYFVSLSTLALLCAVVLGRLLHWSKEAKALERKAP